MLDTPDFDQVVEKYVSTRDDIRELKKKHEAELEPHKETLSLLEAWLLRHLEKLGAKNIKTDNGTVYAVTKSTASLEDPEAFMNFVIQTERYELLDRKANSPAVRDYAEQNGALPPGAKMSTIRTVNVRRSAD